MDTRELAKVDLNLLIALQVLLDERQVSRAAERLHITQPAMSKTLARLRAMFNDPLFIRSNQGMQPTPRALQLAEDLGGILASVNQLIAPRHFDPGSYTGDITLALSEYIGIPLLPPLIRRLHTVAPRLTIRTITRVENQLQELSLGNLDFSIHMALEHYGDDFRVEHIVTNPTVILVRNNHPLATGEITWARLGRFPFIRLYVSDLAQVENFRPSAAFTRSLNPDQGYLETSHILTSLEVLRSTDYFMTGPEYIMQNSSVAEGITALPLPIGESYDLNYMLVAHRRSDTSPVHQWFWQQIMDTLAELRAN